MYKLSIVSQFKNEGVIFKEWIHHYLNEGVEHFYLIDDHSTDDYIDKIQHFIDDGIVEIINGKQWNQKNNYQLYLDKCKSETKWVIVCDLDEFIYSTKYSKISNYLDTLDNSVGQIYIPWKMFGSNGHKEQPNCVVKYFNRRKNYQIPKKRLCKTIIRTSILRSFGIHFSSVTQCDEITPDGVSIQGGHKHLQLMDEESLKKSHLHLNHYAIQSYEWFKSIKMTRGRASTQEDNFLRNEHYFKSYDRGSNEILDDELYNKHK